jgi:hypothetical protein
VVWLWPNFVFGWVGSARERQARPLVVGCSTETGSDAGKVRHGRFLSAEKWTTRSRCPASSRTGPGSLLWVCAVTRRRSPVGASPTRQLLQPEVTVAPPVNHSRCPYARARPYRGRNQICHDNTTRSPALSEVRSGRPASPLRRRGPIWLVSYGVCLILANNLGNACLNGASEAVSTYIMRHLPKGAEGQLTRRLRDQLAQG